MQTMKMIVTPEMALEWLKLNKRNRTINRSRIEGWKRAIADRRFSLTHQGIAFYGNFDELADGQHRLIAISDGDTAVEIMVTTGLLHESVHAIDRGLPRSIGNVLGFLGMPLTTSQVATVRALWLEYHAARNETGWIHGLTDTKRFAVFSKHVEDAVSFAMPSFKRRGLSHASVTAAVASAWFTSSQERLSRFKDLLASGVGASESEMSAVRLREYLLTTRLVSGGTDARQELYFRACTAIRAFMDRRSTPRLYCRPDARFPIPDCKGLD